MFEPPSIVVLHGGLGSEREVSLASGAAVAEALAERFSVTLLDLRARALPDGLDGVCTVVFPALHGAFGEDGGLQAMLEAAGVEYAGSDAAASRLCMDKGRTKAKAVALGVPVPEGRVFDADAPPAVDDLVAELGPELVLKPVDQGSSVGLCFTKGGAELAVALEGLGGGRWLAERRVRGRELTVGLLEGVALGVVEIRSASGVYDYQAKYTPGSTEYRFPAELEPDVAARIRKYAERIFGACGCRDFARIDFLLEEGRPRFLEVNTLPGLTATSLLPKSASCAGYDFESLAAALVAPAMRRFAARRGKEEA